MKNTGMKKGAPAKRKPETIEITVTKTHYDRAVKASKLNSYFVLTQCLIAQAVKSAFPGKAVSVGFDDAEVGRGSRIRKFDLSKKASSLIQKFDDGNLDPKKHLPAVIKLKEITGRWTV